MAAVVVAIILANHLVWDAIAAAVRILAYRSVRCGYCDRPFGCLAAKDAETFIHHTTWEMNYRPKWYEHPSSIHGLTCSHCRNGTVYNLRREFLYRARIDPDEVNWLGE